MARPKKPISRRRVDRAARRYLERWFTARAHLRRLLLRRVDRSIEAHGGDRDEAVAWVDEVLDRLVSEGLLDDDRFARDRAMLLHRRGDSTRRIRAKLAEKGVDADRIRAALETVRARIGDPDRRAAAAYVRKRRIGPYRADPRAHRERDLGKLARAGFSYAVAREVLDLPTRDEVEAIELGLDHQAR